MKDAVVRHYDAKYADDVRNDTSVLAVSDAPTERNQAAMRALLQRLPAGGDVLEIAAGNGLLVRSLLSGGLRCGSYTASEISDVRLGALRATLSDPRVRVARLDVEAAPDDHDGRYDAVVMVALIEHLFDPMRAMQRVRRWLKPGGFALVDTPNIAKWTRRLKLAAGRFPATASRAEGLVTYEGTPVDLFDEGHLHYFTFASLTRMLTLRCGFSRVERVPYATRPHPLGTRAGYALACLWPEMFSEICLVAYA